MSERGVFAVARSVWDHHVLSSKEPFSRREAWIWMLSEAAWKPRIRRVGKAIVEMKRGQLAHSVRHLGAVWGWNKGQVERFLARLKTEEMIETHGGTGVTLITICNYNDYQILSLPTRTLFGEEIETLAGQQQDNREDIKDIKDIANKNKTTAPKGSSASQAQAIYGEIVALLGVEPSQLPRGWFSAPVHIQAWLASGWSREVILRGVAKGIDGMLAMPDTIAEFEGSIQLVHESLMVAAPKTQRRRNGTANGTVTLFDQCGDDWPVDYEQQFWSTYPRRVAHDHAMKALAKVRGSRKVAWSHLIDAVRLYRDSSVNTDPKYIKHPATWLNGGCWKDEVVVHSAAPAPLSGSDTAARAILEARLDEEEMGWPQT